MIQRGFTLIETVVYIALLGILMSGAVLVSYSLLESSQKSSGNTAVQEEGSFVERKLTWALSGASAIVIGGSGCAQTVTITKTGATNPIQLQLNSTNKSVELREGGSGSYTALTTVNVAVSCLQFTSIPASGAAPAGITATTTINGLNFVITKYIRA